ncbi:MAG TPA: glycerol-3-phosphate acyltransferase [Planctomycetes bacterium]|nr:glycerol-3-phosphate acyltransferase [Planctomycetota bacterium]
MALKRTNRQGISSRSTLAKHRVLGLAYLPMLLALDYLSIAPRAATAFVLGAVPFAWLIVRLAKGVDVRTVGSGNVGATNASRAFVGRGARIAVFLLVYLLDAGKGLFGTWLGWGADSDVASSLPGAVICAACAILGHVFTPFLRGRGGKGVATALGVVLVLAPQAVLLAFAVFAGVAGTPRLVALGSILAALAFGGIQLTLMGSQALEARNLSLTIFSVVVPLLIIWRHRSNIVRLVKGTELAVTTPESTDEETPNTESDAGNS